MDTVIATHGLTKSFASKRVVDRLDLEVPRGAIFAFLGDNGAGKSTTIRMLTGLLPADAGRASILGRDCWAEAIPLRHQVGYVPERPRFYDWMTVEEIGWFTSGFHRPPFFERYRDLILGFSLEPRHRLRSLSKGEYAKVGLALALAGEPEVLILDEPTSGLDLFVRREFLASMVDLAGEGRTIFLSTHLVSEVERIASHVAFLARGKLLLAGPLDDIRARIVRLDLQLAGPLPDLTSVGTVLSQEVLRRQARVTLLDPNREALSQLEDEGLFLTMTETTLGLEEIYTALLARVHARFDRQATEQAQERLAHNSQVTPVSFISGEGEP